MKETAGSKVAKVMNGTCPMHRNCHVPKRKQRRHKMAELKYVGAAIETPNG
jgi:hypothetical protein